MLDINVLNRLSYHLCVETNEQVRREAEETLNKILDSSDCLNCCLLLLDQGEPPYAAVVASSALRRLLTKKIGVTLQERVDLNQYLLMYLVKKGSTIEKYSLNSLCKIFALLTKISWLDRVGDEALPFQEPVPNLISAAKEPTENGYLALKLLTSLVEEINSEEGIDTVSKQRKIASDFRDTRLLDIFLLSLDILKASMTRQLADAAALKCVVQALDLSLACVNFDFIGSLSDETLDENVNIQVPTKWRPVLIERDVPKLYFDLYLSLPAEYLSKVFQILVQLASVRRMLFDTADRQKYLEYLVDGLKSILEHSEKLDDSENFHHLCRFISRVKANYQVAELMKCPNFAQLLAMLAQFTVQSFCTVEVLTTNSAYYLLSFWSRMAGSLSYARVDVDSIADYIPKICIVFIESRMLLADVVVRLAAVWDLFSSSSGCLFHIANCFREGREDPLDDTTSLRQNMELFTGLCRRSYKETVQKLVDLFDQNMAILVNVNTAQEKTFAQKRLIWIITMMAAGICGKAMNSSIEAGDDTLDGEIVSRVWCLMRETDKRLGGIPSSADCQLEYAYLYLMEEFRKAYVCDQVHRESQIYEKLGQILGISDDDGVLKLFTQKINTNLKFWGKSKKLLSLTLALLNDLSVGFSNVRRLLKTDGIQLLLRNHADFEFVSSCTDLNIIRSRSGYYAALVRLLNIDLDDNPSIFKLFMQPLAVEFDNLFNMFETGHCSNEGQESVRFRIIGLSRDLRGIASSCTKKTTFNQLINWLLPKAFTVLHCAIRFWIADADVTTPILKLLVELSLNRQSRLNYDMHSCLTVVMFREISKIICDYGTGFLTLPEVSKENFYKQRIKNVGSLSLIMRHVLSGNYLPFGVFWLYGDRCLADALDVLFKLFVYVVDRDLLTYTKVAHGVYYWLDIVTRDNMAYISKLDKSTFLTILKATQAGVSSLDTTIVTSSCAALDQILDYLFERLFGDTNEKSLTREPDGNNCLDVVKENPDLLEKLMTSLLNQVMFDNMKCHWSMSRPLLGLIIAYEEVYNKWKVDFILRQPADVQATLEKMFDALMDGVKRDVTLKGKDSFTQNFCAFRKNVELLLRGTPNTALDLDYADNQFMTD